MTTCLPAMTTYVNSSAVILCYHDNLPSTGVLYYVTMTTNCLQVSYDTMLP